MHRQNNDFGTLKEAFYLKKKKDDLDMVELTFRIRLDATNKSSIMEINEGSDSWDEENTLEILAYLAPYITEGRFVYFNEDEREYWRYVYVPLSEKWKRQEGQITYEKGIETPTAYLLKKGYSLYNTQCLPVWNSHMVRKILLNPIYAGIMTNHKSEKKDLSTKSCVRLPRKDWIYVPGTHEAIVTADELDKVMGMVETGAAYHGPQKIPKNIFRYKLKCGYCGRALRVRSENKTPAMGCSTSKVSQNTKCYAGQYKTAEFEKLFLKLVQREAALAEDTLKQIKQVSKTQNLSKLKSRKKGCEEKVQKVKQQKMEFYEAFVDGKVTKEGYLRKKELLTQKEHRYKELITELQEQIIQAEEKRKLAKSPELLAFSKCKDLTELSYEVIQELVEVIYFYDPEHIEVIWKYRDEFLEAEKALAE